MLLHQPRQASASTSRAAATACLSEIGLALMFQIDSSACESASSPAASVGPAGSESVSSGSTIAASGQVSARCSEYFSARQARFQTVAQRRDFAAGARGRGNGDQGLDAMRA